MQKGKERLTALEERLGMLQRQCKDAGIPDAEIATRDEKRLLKERYGVQL